jgi:hypothetical protein
VRDIPVQPPVAIPVRTVQEAVRSFMWYDIIHDIIPILW